MGETMDRRRAVYGQVEGETVTRITQQCKWLAGGGATLLFIAARIARRGGQRNPQPPLCPLPHTF